MSSPPPQCMPDWIPWDPRHPGSPCLLETFRWDEAPRWAGTTMCLNCGSGPADIARGRPWWFWLGGDPYGPRAICGVTLPDTRKDSDHG